MWRKDIQYQHKRRDTESIPCIVIEHVRGTNVADLKIILTIGGYKRVDEEGEDARRTVGEAVARTTRLVVSCMLK